MSSRAQRRELERKLKKGKETKNLYPENLLYQAKYVLSHNQLGAFLGTISNEQLDYFEGNPIPKNYSDIRKTGSTFANDDFTKEIIWYKRIIIKYANYINLFLELEASFESYFLEANYIEAKRILERIEKEICVSIWSIEKRLLLAEYDQGFKKQKELLSDIVSEENDTLVNILARYFSIRVEKNLSHIQYEGLIQSYLSNYNDVKIRNYLLYKLNFYKQYTYPHKGLLLNIENNASIIDRYKLIINCFLLSICEQTTKPDELLLIKNTALELSEYIYDKRLKNILFCLGAQVSIVLDEVDQAFLDITNDYTRGDYQLSYIKSKELLKNNPSFFETYEIYVKSCINSNQDFENVFIDTSPAGKTLVDLLNITLKNEDTTLSSQNIYKSYNSIGLTNWSYKLFSFLNSENSLFPIDFKYYRFALSNSSFYNPILSILIKTQADALNFLDAFKRDDSETIHFWKCINRALLEKKNLELDETKVFPYRKAFYEVKIQQLNGELKTAIENYTSLLESDIYAKESSLAHNKEEIISSITVSLLSLERYKDAAVIVTDNVIDNPHFINKLRYDFLINEIQSSENQNIISEISSPIFLHQYQATQNNIWIAYDNYLSSLGLDFPHDLVSMRDAIPSKKLVYFLKNISKPEIYDSSYMFDGQDDMDNERIEICLALTNLDKDNTDEYIKEISEISRNQLIRKGIKQIDESKIYVDVKGIKNNLEKELRESFDRSLNLLNLSLNQLQKLDVSIENIIVPYYGKSYDSNKVELKDDNIKITSYSRFEQFVEMFSKIRDKFIASNEYGIETYLSMRIRHGTLLGEIRSVFENYHLITKKESGTEDYQDNPYWTSKFNNIDPAKLEHFNKIMADFSSEIDKIPDELKNKVLQIKTEKKPSQGLFDYSYSRHDLLMLFRHKLGGIEDYEEFFDSTIEELWIKTEKNLAEIRNYFSESTKMRTINLLTELQRQLEELLNKFEHPVLNELIRNITSCQTAITTELDKIAQWFQRTKSRTINEFYIDLPLDASLTTIQRIYPKFSDLKPDIINNTHLKYEGEYFEKFTDLIQNLLDNIIKHSNLNSDELDVKIELKEQDDELTIKLTNNISDLIDLDSRNRRIKETREILAQKHHSDLTRNEGGTGYPKIKKIIKSDLGREKFSIILSDIGEDRIFTSELKFETSNLEKL